MTEGLSQIESKIKYPVETDTATTETSTSEKTEPGKAVATKSSAATTPLFGEKKDKVKVATKDVDAMVFAVEKENIPTSSKTSSVSALLAGEKDTSSDYGDALHLGATHRGSKGTVGKPLSKNTYEIDLRNSHEFDSTYMPDVESLNNEQRALLDIYQKEFKKDKITMGARRAIARYNCKIKENIIVPNFKEEQSQDFNDGTASANRTARHVRRASNIKTYTRERLLAQPDMTEEDRQIVVISGVEDIEADQTEILEVVGEIIPENITKEKAEEILHATTEYAVAQRDDIMDHVRNGNYSEDFQSKIINKCAKVHADTIKNTHKFIQHFWETEKGRAILSYTRRVIENLKEQREKYVEKQEVASVKTQEAEEAEKAAELAKEEAAKARKKAESVLEELGLKNLRADVMKKVLKQTSPKELRKLEEAEYKQNKAYWAEFEANIEKENAIHNARIAEKSIAIIKSTAIALMRVARSSFGA